MELNKLVCDAGILGAGGAGFPTHVKINCKAEFVLANGAECEPLLRVDQQVMQYFAADVVRGIRAVKEFTGAKRAVICLKEHYHAAVAALQEVLKDADDVELHLLQGYYPAGDEQQIVYEVTGRVVPTGGLPLDVSKVRRIWPCQGGEGHFMARLVKAGTPRTLPPEGEYTPEEQLWLAAAAEAGKKGKGKAKPAKVADARSARRADSRACRDAVQGTSRRTRDTGAGEATPAQSLAAWQEFARQYFPALAQRPAVVHGGGVLLPVAFPQTGLHVLRAGVFVGSVQKGRFVPEHHLFTAFGAQCANREELTLADPRCVEYLSGREVEARTAADGWCCVTVDGWPLGGGKVSGGRVKNHYPKALRLL